MLAGNALAVVAFKAVVYVWVATVCVDREAPLCVCTPCPYAPLVSLLQVRVMRGGVEQTLSCFNLLVGDVLLVEAGDILPADGLLFAGGQLK